jgi:hypothetical protein
MGYQDRLALDYLSKMKIAVMVRQLDLGHILWCGRVVRVERAHRVRVVRGVQKMLDVGNGVIGFDHVRFHVRDLVMAFLEDELVRCCVTYQPLDRVAQTADRKYCRPHARSFRLGFPRKVPVFPICPPAAL